ncbi:GNAT family N-acetyltransferase [Paraclostridium bifermentans]|uniref:GNAT family N-acetyltransferase n=1 Tax=Paraclostridium bifermentans TaxID=1490 RepID=UPI0029122B2A|nr:GNAT family N-acetyltransferase [Paraclostridium bifermentans]MDU3337934.1 GNAT family N-acetyltransferase [Paraclostridium bifermentans]
MVNYDTLENVSIERLHNTFMEAFSDYEVKIDMPILKLKQRLQRTGYVTQASMGASDNDVLVGFLLNSIREWDGKVTAYDTGTGVIKEYRNKGITSAMFLNVLKNLKEMEVKQYLLEVIQSNTSAVHLYKKQGFEVSREFECFNLEKKLFTFTPIHQVKHIDDITEIDWVRLMSFWDFKPSWQNSIDSIKALSDAFICSTVSINDEIVGYGIIDKNTGDIPQIAVDKNYRGKGIGSSILADLVKNTESSTLNVVNIDSQCISVKDFLLNLGFKLVVKQYEMILAL